MAKFDQRSNLQFARALEASISNATPVNGNLIDLKGFEAATFFVFTGTITAATGGINFKLQHSDTTEGGDFADVAAADYIGDPADLEITENDNDQVVGTIGYRGNKRYLRMVVTGHASNDAALVRAVCAKGRPHLAETAPTQANIAAT